MLEKLKKVIKTKEDFKLLIDSLILRIYDDRGISGNKMLDGFIIGLIHSNSYLVWSILSGEDKLAPMSENAIQQLEQVVIWLHNHETKVIKQFKYAKSGRNLDISRYLKTSVKDLEVTITDIINKTIKKISLGN